jgi:hypothetical protein
VPFRESVCNSAEGNNLFEIQKYAGKSILCAKAVMEIVEQLIYACTRLNEPSKEINYESGETSRFYEGETRTVWRSLIPCHGGQGIHD